MSRHIFLDPQQVLLIVPEINFDGQQISFYQCLTFLAGNPEIN